MTAADLFNNIARLRGEVLKIGGSEYVETVDDRYFEKQSYAEDKF